MEASAGASQAGFGRGRETGAAAGRGRRRNRSRHRALRPCRRVASGWLWVGRQTRAGVGCRSGSGIGCAFGGGGLARLRLDQPLQRIGGLLEDLAERLERPAIGAAASIKRCAATAATRTCGNGKAGVPHHVVLPRAAECRR